MSNIAKNISHIHQLAECMMDMPQVDSPVKHHFSKGVYAREILMSKNTLVVGKIHKTRHLNIISQGHCTVVTPARKIEVIAPYTFESVAGEQKVVLMHEDTVWTTIHLTEETDVAKIEKECIAEEYDESLVNQLIGGLEWLG